MKHAFAPASLVLALALAPGSGLSQDAKEQKKAPKTEARQADKTDRKAEAPDQAAAMKAWQQFATPGEGHKKMEAMVGTWTAHVKMWMAPGAPPQESDGAAEFASILGGRFVEEKFQGTAMGQPFEGRGWSGYDNNKKKYVATWIDNMTTAIMLTTGSYDASGKTLTSTGTIEDPLTKKTQKVKSAATNPDADHMVYEMWGPDPSGKIFKTLEIVYTRKK